MKEPRDKAGLVDGVKQEKACWEALLQVVGQVAVEEDMLSPGLAGDWNFKDVVAHLTGWRKRTVARFAGARQGTAPLLPDWPSELGDDVHAVNGWIQKTNHDRTLAEVLTESHLVWQQLVDSVEALREADLLEPGRFEWFGPRPLGPANLSGSLEHLHEHSAQIHEWIARLLDPS